MFANCQIGGMNMAIPDVCKTPAPPAPFIPVPYPNIAQLPVAIPLCVKVLISAGFAHNLMTITPLSNGDEAGVMGGLISQIFIGPSKHMLGSFGVLHCGLPATRSFVDMTGQNGMVPNAFGMTTVPSQFKVMIMK
jgi:hypothetical protein